MVAPRRFVLLCAAALAGAAAGDTSREVAALEKQFEAARAEWAKAEERLVATYERLDTVYHARCGSRDAVRDALIAALRETAPQHRERMLQGKGGKAPPAAVQLAVAQEWLAAALARPAPQPDAALDPLFVAPLAAALAEPLREPLAVFAAAGVPEATNPPDAAAGAALAAAVGLQLERVFDGGDFGRLWNEQMFKAVPDAQDYARQYAAYKEIGIRLDKARSPEKFDASGQRLPPGMVLVKGGSYEVGPDQGFARKGLERRATRVTVKPFFIDRTEVTNADYLKFLTAQPADRMKELLPSGWKLDEYGAIVPPPGKDDHPVTGVSFNDALAFAQSVGKRLPTEDEWEAAARGPKATRYPWGAEYETGRANDRDAGKNDTLAVGSFPNGASHFGCLDLAGNVEEWTSTTSDGDPVEAPLGSSLIQVVIRGGNYNSNADLVAATFRWYSPGMTTRKATLGFRCAQAVPK